MRAIAGPLLAASILGIIAAATGCGLIAGLNEYSFDGPLEGTGGSGGTGAAAGHGGTAHQGGSTATGGSSGTGGREETGGSAGIGGASGGGGSEDAGSEDAPADCTCPSKSLCCDGCHPLNESLECNDGNGCTEQDRCVGGVCVGSIPKSCEPLDECHMGGTCDPTTGLCTNPAKPDQEECSTDHDGCTNDRCIGGVCTHTMVPNDCDAFGCGISLSGCHVCKSPSSCIQLGRGCGSWADGCGGELTCGPCASGTSCDNEGHCVASGLADSPWPMAEHDAMRTSTSPYLGPAGPSVRWERALSEEICGGPVIAADGEVIYVSTIGGKLAAVGVKGIVLWEKQVGPVSNGSCASPLVGDDGTIFVPHRDGRLRAVTPDGTVAWTFDTGGSLGSSPATQADGTLYVASDVPSGGADDTFLWAVSRSGQQQWHAFAGKNGGFQTASPAIRADGSVIVAVRGGPLVSFTPQGAKHWESTGYPWILATPVIASLDRVLISTNYQNNSPGPLTMLASGGTTLWENPYLGHGQPAIVAGETVITPAFDAVAALASNGALQWSYPLAKARVAVASDGTVFACNFDSSEIHTSQASKGSLVAIDATGKEVWHRDGIPGCESSLAIGADRTLYYAMDRVLVSIGPGTCVPSCLDKECSTDGCGGTCGTCLPRQAECIGSSTRRVYADAARTCRAWRCIQANAYQYTDQFCQNGCEHGECLP